MRGYTILAVIAIVATAFAATGWFAGEVVDAGQYEDEAAYYIITVKDGSTVVDTEQEHIDAPYVTDSLDTGSYTVICALYNEYDRWLTSLGQYSRTIYDGDTTTVNFNFPGKGATALTPVSWGAVKAQ